MDKSRPIANAGEDRRASVGDAVVFDASASKDNIGIASYEWDFGDGERGAGVRVTHVYKKVYKKAGTYTVTLTVKDYAGNTGSHSITVIIVETFPMLRLAIAMTLVLIVVIVVTLALRRRAAKR